MFGIGYTGAFTRYYFTAIYRMHGCSEIETLMDKKRNRSTSIVHFYYLSKYKTHRQVECLTNHKNATYFICRSNSMFKGTKCNKTAI